KTEARTRFGLGETEKILLFFGQIAPYKGLDLLVDAMRSLGPGQQDCRLVVAGKPKVGFESYWQTVKTSTEDDRVRSRVVMLDKFIPDADVPVLFRAADAWVLPYREIYQSGPMSLAYRFGTPVVATRVGSFPQDVVPDVTGVLCQPDNPAELAAA